MLRILITTVLLVLISVPPTAQGQVDTYKFTHTYDNNGIESKCYFYVPRSYNPDQSYPLFFAWHGAGMPGREMREFMMSTIAKSIDAIVVAPDANNTTEQIQIDFLADTSLNFILSEYNIDRNRMIITGYSWGGRVAYETGLRHPHVFSGIIGIAPAIIESDLDEHMWNNIDKRRMATIIGDHDINYSLVDYLMNEIKYRGGPLLYKVKPDINHWDTYFEQDLFREDYRECYNYVLGVTSVDDKPTPNNFSVSHYPSPANESVSFTVSDLSQSEVSLRVRDLTGRIVYDGLSRSVPSQGHVMLQTAAFPAGMYFAEIHSRNAMVIEPFLITHR